MRKDIAFPGGLAGVGVATLAVSAVLMVIAFTGWHRTLFASGGERTVTAVFAETLKLRKGDPVRVRGIEVGTVERLDVNPGARTSTVTMKVDEDQPLYADSRAGVRWKTLLGSAFFVELDRGTPGSGPLAGTRIPLERTHSQVELEDVTRLIRGDVRRGLQTLPGELSDALGDRRGLTHALSELAHISPDVDRGVGALRGLEPESDLRTLASSAADTMRALDAPTGGLQRLLEGAGTTLETTAARNDELRNTISRAPAVMDRTEQTLVRLDRTLDLADPLVSKLQDPADDVAPTVAALRPTVVSADTLLRRARPLLRSLEPAVRSLAAAARVTRPLLTSLVPSLERLDKKILPYMAEIDPQTQHSASQMVGPALAGLGSGAGGQMDANGRFIRFPATSGSNPFYLPCQIYAGNPDKKGQLAHCESLKTMLDTLFSYDPIPPGSRKAR